MKFHVMDIYHNLKKKKQILEQKTHSPPDKSGHMEIMKTQVLHVKQNFTRELFFQGAMMDSFPQLLKMFRDPKNI